jgi:hypothetical protein
MIISFINRMVVLIAVSLGWYADATIIGISLFFYFFIGEQCCFLAQIGVKWHK